MNTFHLMIAATDGARWIRLALFALLVLLFSPFGFAEDQVSDPIQIVADKLITNNEEKYAEFLGDVRATHENFVITSESLRIYYKDDLVSIKNQSGKQELIKRIVARGNVEISSEKYRGETERVEYDLDTMVFVLSGKNSTLKSGKNLITGSKITVYRKDEQIKVEGSPEKRVKAVFYSNELQKEEAADNPKEPAANKPSQEPAKNTSESNSDLK